jgi:hypothetical protein
MAYADISLLAADSDFTMRVSACAATESIDDPYNWASLHSWDMAAMPGFGDKYASAIAANVERPGWDASVISDAEILSAVQSLNVP